VTTCERYAARLAERSRLLRSATSRGRSLSSRSCPRYPLFGLSISLRRSLSLSLSFFLPGGRAPRFTRFDLMGQSRNCLVFYTLVRSGYSRLRTHTHGKARSKTVYIYCPFREGDNDPRGRSRFVRESRASSEIPRARSAMRFSRLDFSRNRAS